MKINSITINNFQSYYGEQTMEFTDGLNLVIGNGGKGKSKLFNAFYWALFGQIYVTSEGWCATDDLYHTSRGALHRFEYVNKKALYDCEVGNKVSCYVQLDLTDDKKNNYVIERQASALRQPTQDWNQPEAWRVSPSSLKVTCYGGDIIGTPAYEGIMAEKVVADLFPEGIRGYIWFQGESLDSLIDFRSKQKLKDAVSHISYYPYFEKLMDIISKAKEKIGRIESKKLKEANRQNTEIRALLQKIDYLRDRLQTEQENKRTYESNITQIEIALAEDDAKLQGLAGYSKLISDYNKNEQEIKDINNQLTEIDKEQRRLLPSLWVLRGIDSLVERSKEIISSHVATECTAPEKKYIDEPSRRKLEDILTKDHQCFVCGSPVDEAHPHAVEWIWNRLRMQEEYYKELEDYRNNLEFSKSFNRFVGKIEDYPDYLLRSLKGIDKQFRDTEEEMERLIAKRRRFLDKKVELNEEIEAVKQQHGIDPLREASKVPTLTSNIRASRSQLDRQKHLLKTCQKTLSNYEDQLQEAEKDLTKMGVGSTGAVSQVAETEWKHISTFLESVCQDVQENARRELLRKIEERANVFYDKFTEHDQGYKGRVEIGDDYAITFDGGLNTSHEQRKKMSIINALLSLNQEAIGTYYPFISDAPTSNFDPTTAHKYLMGIKDIFGQSIIMTKDVEVGSQKYQALYGQRNVSRIYQLGSKLYGDVTREPEIWEVSTVVEQLK